MIGLQLIRSSRVAAACLLLLLTHMPFGHAQTEPGTNVPPPTATQQETPSQAPQMPSVPPAATPSPVPAAASTQPPIPPRPDDPRAAKVYSVFETHCARCHQSGKLENRSWAAGGITNILSLTDVASDPALVRPGSPDASPIYEVLRTLHAPVAAFITEEPQPDDAEAVRNWIRELPAAQQACGGRPPIKSQAVEAMIDEALRVARDGAKDLRFISLVNLYNACANGERMSAYRQAAAKILNSLSWTAAPQKLTPLDAEGTVLSFKLADFGWVSGHWEAIQRIYPRAYAIPLAETTRTLAGDANVVVRADWLAEAVSSPQLYYQLLGVPQKLSELAKMSAVDIDQNLRIGRARRAVIRDSAITHGNRLAERHPGVRGGFWLIHDFSTSTGDQDLFERPLGPKISPLTKAPFKADNVRAQFALPNGFFAYALFDGSGNRIDRVLPGVEKPATDATAPALAGRAGLVCAGCHNEGVKQVRDAYRPYASALTSSTGKDVRDAALQLSGIDSEMQLLQDGDNERYRNALWAAGIAPTQTIDGEEIVSALARRYGLGVDLAGAAVELGLERQTFEAALAKIGGPAVGLARRIQHGRLPRPDVERLLSYLKGIEPAAEVRPPVPKVPRNSDSIGLSLWIDKARPSAGDLIAINAEADKDCFLTVINVDAAGKATVLFPNDFEPDNLISAGKPVRVPGANAPYQLRLKEEGRETLIAQCSTSPAPPTGIEYDFGRQRFTVLGNWENFVRDSLVTEADLRRNPKKAERARSARAQALRRMREGGSRVEDRQDTSPDRPLLDGRAVIVLGNG